MFAKVEPFSAEETARYIAHRLKVAGYSGGELFTGGAMEIIKDRTNGNPRNINRLCFSALSLGCAVGRKRIDADMMREVVGDLEVESRERESPHPLALVPQCKNLAETTDAPVISYPAASNRRLPGWALFVAGVAASIAIAVGLLSYSHGRIWQFLPRKAASAVTPYPSSSAQGSAQAAPASSAVSSPNGDTLDAPAATTTPPSPPSVHPQAPTDDESNTVKWASLFRRRCKKVVVRPGETLQQIALRTLGQDDSQILKEIQRLNPRLTNPDHIEADQEIRLPQMSRASNAPPVGRAN
jgi:hypothetical protein